MKSLLRYSVFILLISFLITSCKKDEESDPIPEVEINTIPEFYKAAFPDVYGLLPPDFTVIASSSEQVDHPQDLDFHPTTERKHELWLINEGTENTGGSVVIVFDAGLSSQSSERRVDGNAWHFMSLPTAIAFSPDNENFATSAGVFNANHNAGGVPFTGPTLWSSDLNVFAKYAGPGTNGSHLDMLHETPYGMGIAHEKDNVFWVFDGFSSEIVRYDFVDDHGPGNHYHGDAKIHRYPEVSVSRKASVPGHMVLDKNSGWMYICDPGNSRVIRVNIHTGTKKRDLPLLYETLAERQEMENVEWEVFATTNLSDPCGVDISDDRLFVSDNATGEVVAYDIGTKEELGRLQTSALSIKGIKIGPEGKLWYVDYTDNSVVRVDPN